MTKAGRNDPCPCGSGKKYKKCHGVGGAKKFVATVISTNKEAAVGRISSLIGDIAKTDVPSISLKDRMSKSIESKDISKEIQKGKFHQEDIVEEEKRSDKNENFPM